MILFVNELMLIIIFSLSLSIPNSYAGCKISLKDGRIIKSDSCQEIGNQIFYYKYGAKIKIRKDKISEYIQDSKYIDTNQDSYQSDINGGSYALDDKVDYSQYRDDDIIQRVKSKYDKSFNIHDFLDYKRYKDRVEPLLSIKEQYAYANALINKKMEVLEWTKNEYKDAEPHRRKERIKYVEGKLLEAKMAIVKLDKYTNNRNTSRKKSPRKKSRYTDTEIEYAKSKIAKREKNIGSCIYAIERYKKGGISKDDKIRIDNYKRRIVKEMNMIEQIRTQYNLPMSCVKYDSKTVAKLLRD